MKIEIGGGFLGTLTLIFVVFKLLHIIDWSWWLVFAPVLLGVAITIFIIVFMIIIIIVLSIIGAFTE